MKKTSVTGVVESDKALQKLEPKVAKKILRKAMRKSMKPVQQAAKQNAPVDEGDLKKAIKLKAGKRSSKGISINVQVGESDNLFVGKQFYAGFIEFGAPNKNIAPRGFMRRAYDEKKDEAKDIAHKAIIDIIEDEANKSK